MDAATLNPSPSMALVPLPRAAVDTGKDPRHLHRWFYGLGYASLAVVWTGAWLQPRGEGVAIGLFVLGMLGVGVAGMGVLVHVLWRPRMHKLRQGLAAVASLVLTVAAIGPVMEAGREAYASSRIVQWQPLAEDLARDGRIHPIGLGANGRVEYDAAEGTLADAAGWPTVGGPPEMMTDRLLKGGIPPRDVEALMERMRLAGVDYLEARDGYAVFTAGGTDLLYAFPGRPLPPPGTRVLNQASWHTRPLGGGWYLLGG